jgi:hypothetical protein
MWKADDENAFLRGRPLVFSWERPHLTKSQKNPLPDFFPTKSLLPSRSYIGFQTEKPLFITLIINNGFFGFQHQPSLLTSSLSLGVPVPRPTQCMGGA